MNTIRFTSKALFVALLSTGLLAPISAEPKKTVRKKQTQSLVKDTAKAGMLSSAYNWTTGKLGNAYESTKGFAKDNAKTAGIGFVAGAAVTGAGLAAYKYGKTATQKAWNYAKQHPYKAAAIAAGTTAAVVGGLYGASKYGYLTIPTYTAVKESASTAATSAYNYAKENKLATAVKTAVGLGSAAAGSAAVLGANAYLTAEKAEEVEHAAGCNAKSCKGGCRRAVVTPAAVVQVAQVAPVVQQAPVAAKQAPEAAKQQKAFGYINAQGEIVETGLNKKVIVNDVVVHCRPLSKLQQ